ncbi:MAG: hypothetical protein WB711_10790 [Terriglobales bacterium]
MRIRKAISSIPMVAILAALGLLAACSVNVKDHGDEGNSKVDISTPVGGIHVDENADAHDAGLPVYPGARLKPKKDGDAKSANVNLSAFGYGLKVVALEYDSDDPPYKIIAFYQNQLKKYGNIVQCHSSSSFKDDGSVIGGKKGIVVGGKLKCDEDSGNTVELKAGTDDNQHIVSVDPEGKGSDFAIVWVRVLGKQGDI